MVVFSLMGRSPLVPSEFLVFRRTLCTSILVRFRLQDFHLLRLVFPVPFDYLTWMLSRYHTNISICTSGCSNFARHYFRNRFYFLFLRVLRCFSSPGSLHYTMCSYNDNAASLHWVPSFGYLRVAGYLLLSVAFRSLSRPSSAPCT